MAKKSAGILLYRRTGDTPEFFLVHPGGPFYTKKDLGVWTIPKGEFEEEDPLTAARREFEEETGIPIDGSFLELDPVVQKGGKKVFAWALEYDLDPSSIRSNTFEMQWPPRSGRMQQFPEIDKGEWFETELAREKINAAQVNLIDQVVVILNGV